jgi:hypothetical protein
MFNRRTFLNSVFAGSALGLLDGWHPPAAAQDTVRRFRIWDAHSHLHSVPGGTPEERMAVLIRCADRLGIERLILSQGYSADLHPTRDQLREENEIGAKSRSPNRVRLRSRSSVGTSIRGCRVIRSKAVRSPPATRDRHAVQEEPREESHFSSPSVPENPDSGSRPPVPIGSFPAPWPGKARRRRGPGHP